MSTTITGVATVRRNTLFTIDHKIVNTQDEVRSQDTMFVVGAVTGSVKGRELAWNFVKENWTLLHSRYKGGFLLSRLIKVQCNSILQTTK